MELKMTQIIELLEKMGQDASLQNESKLATLIESIELPENIERAILTNDSEELAQDLNTRPNIFCGVFPAEDDEPTEGDDEKESEIKFLKHG